MTDEKYTLISDIKEKKAAAHGAFARKGGSRSKRCSLPSDNLTPAQLKRRNSPVSTVKLNQPITWFELKELTPTLQVLYLDNLIHHYHGRLCDIAAMLGVEPTTLGGHIKRLPGKLNFTGVRGKRKVQPPEWLEFIGGQAPEIVPEDVRATPDPDPIVEAQPVEIEQPFIPQPAPGQADAEPEVEIRPISTTTIAKPNVLPRQISFTLDGTVSDLAALLSVFTEENAAYSFDLTIRKA